MHLRHPFLFSLPIFGYILSSFAYWDHFHPFSVIFGSYGRCRSFHYFQLIFAILSHACL
jgi:hypothetical protein